MNEIDEIELIRKHYGDFTGLYDPSQAVAHVKVLLAEVDAYERNIEDLNDKALKAIRDLGQQRDEARAELARYAERLDQLAAVEQDRDRLQSLFPLMIDELEDLSKGSCWRGPLGFASCDNGGCTHRRALLSKARALVTEPTGTEAKHLPHAPCHETGVHQPHPWGDPSHWCDGSGEVS